MVTRYPRFVSHGFKAKDLAINHNPIGVNRTMLLDKTPGQGHIWKCIAWCTRMEYTGSVPPRTKEQQNESNIQNRKRDSTNNLRKHIGMETRRIPLI